MIHRNIVRGYRGRLDKSFRAWVKLLVSGRVLSSESLDGLSDGRMYMALLRLHVELDADMQRALAAVKLRC